MVFQLLCKMHNIILRLVVVFRQLVSSFQLFSLKVTAENSDLSGPGLAKVMIASHWIFLLGKWSRRSRGVKLLKTFLMISEETSAVMCKLLHEICLFVCLF